MPCSTAEVLTPTTREFTILQADGSGLKVPTTAACPVRKAERASHHWPALTFQAHWFALLTLVPRERRDLHPKQGAGPKFLSGFSFFSFKGGAAHQPEATPSQSSSSNYSVRLLACTWLEPSSLICPSARLPTQWHSHFSISTIITFLISVSTTIYGAVTMCQAPCSKLSYVISFRPGSNSKRRWLFYRQDELLDLAHPPGRQDLNVSLFDFPIWALNFPISHPVLWLPADAYVP